MSVFSAPAPAMMSLTREIGVILVIRMFILDILRNSDLVSGDPFGGKCWRESDSLEGDQPALEPGSCDWSPAATKRKMLDIKDVLIPIVFIFVRNCANFPAWCLKWCQNYANGHNALCTAAAPRALRRSALGSASWSWWGLLNTEPDASRRPGGRCGPGPCAGSSPVRPPRSGGRQCLGRQDQSWTACAGCTRTTSCTHCRVANNWYHTFNHSIHIASHMDSSKVAKFASVAMDRIGQHQLGDQVGLVQGLISRPLGESHQGQRRWGNWALRRLYRINYT